MAPAPEPRRVAGPRVLVVGGSISGLTAALALRDEGCDVQVFERAPVTLEGRGAGIVVHPRTVQYLIERDPRSIEDIGVSARWFRYLDREGGVQREEACRYLFTSYTSIYHPLRLLLDGDRYHIDREATDFEQDVDGVTVNFADGSSERGEMLVCADGVNSAGRRQLAPQVQPEYAGYIAWRGTLGREEMPAPTWEALEEAITYFVDPRPGDGEHFLNYPIPGPRADRGGSPLANWLWYRNLTPEERDRHLIGRDGTRFVASVPPGQVQDRYLEQLSADAGERLPPPLADVVRRTAEPFVQVIVDLGSERMSYGRTCVIGDAAFAVRPHVAAGAAKGADDALTLAQAMHDADNDVTAALESWEPERLRVGRHVLRRAREAGDGVQFNGTWTPRTPLPFGLLERGDGQMTASVPTPR